MAGKTPNIKVVKNKYFVNNAEEPELDIVVYVRFTHRMWMARAGGGGKDDP